MGIPDAGVPIPKVKPCDRYIIVQPDNVAHCMTNEEFRRWVRRNMPTN